MSLLKWSQEYSVGNTELDEHHQHLFDLLGEVFALLTQDDIDDQLNEILDKLKAYTEFHFSAEEKKMLASGYPLYEDHKEKHDQFIKRIHELTETKASSSYDSLEDLLLFLNQWLVNHIMNEDKRYKDKI